MNKDPRVIQQTAEQMERMCRILASLSRDVLPESEDRFAVMAEGPLDELDRMRQEISAFVHSIESQWPEAREEVAAS